MLLGSTLEKGKEGSRFGRGQGPTVMRCHKILWQFCEVLKMVYHLTKLSLLGARGPLYPQLDVTPPVMTSKTCYGYDGP